MGPDAYSTRSTRAALGLFLLLTASYGTANAAPISEEIEKSFPAPESGPAPTQGAAPPTLGAASPTWGAAARIGPIGARIGPSKPYHGHGAEPMTQTFLRHADSVSHPAPESGPAVPGSGPAAPESGPTAPESGPAVPGSGPTSDARDPSDSDSDEPPPLISGSDSSDSDSGDDGINAGAGRTSRRLYEFTDDYRDSYKRAWIYYVNKDGRAADGSTYARSGRLHQGAYERPPFRRTYDVHPDPSHPDFGDMYTLNPQFESQGRVDARQWLLDNVHRPPLNAPERHVSDLLDLGYRRLNELASTHRTATWGPGRHILSLLGTLACLSAVHTLNSEQGGLHFGRDAASSMQRAAAVPPSIPQWATGALVLAIMAVFTAGAMVALATAAWRRRTADTTNKPKKRRSARRAGMMNSRRSAPAQPLPNHYHNHHHTRSAPTTAQPPPPVPRHRQARIRRWGGRPNSTMLVMFALALSAPIVQAGHDAPVYNGDPRTFTTFLGVFMAYICVKIDNECQGLADDDAANWWTKTDGANAAGVPLPGAAAFAALNAAQRRVYDASSKKIGAFLRLALHGSSCEAARAICGTKAPSDGAGQIIALRARYGARRDDAAIVELHSQMTDCRIGSSTYGEHIDRFTAVLTKLGDIGQAPTDTHAIAAWQRSFTEDMKNRVGDFLRANPGTTVTAIHAEWLLRFRDQRSRAPPMPQALAAISDDHHAMAANTSSPGARRHAAARADVSQVGQSRRYTENCPVCGKRGHSRDTCWERGGAAADREREDFLERRKQRNLSAPSRGRNRDRRQEPRRHRPDARASGGSAAAATTAAAAQPSGGQWDGWGTASSSWASDGEDETGAFGMAAHVLPSNFQARTTLATTASIAAAAVLTHQGYTTAAIVIALAAVLEHLVPASAHSCFSAITSTLPTGVVRFLVDSGCTSHVTNDRSILTDFQPESGSRAMRSANGTPCPIAGSGTVHATCLTGDSRSPARVVLHNVLFVPSFSMSLLSVPTATSAGNSSFTFTGETCSVRLGSSPPFLATRDKQSGALFLDIIPKSTPEQAVAAIPTPSRNSLPVLPNAPPDTVAPVTSQAPETTTAAGRVAMAKFVHRAFAHASYRSILETLLCGTVEYPAAWLVAVKHVVRHPEGAKCYNCAKARLKSTLVVSATSQPSRQPVSTRATVPALEMCCDIWSAPCKAIQGFRYVLLFVCSATGYMFPVLLRSKSEAGAGLRSLLSFLRSRGLVANGSGITLRGDNESGSGTFRHEADAAGVNLQLTSPHSPHQNGRAERNLGTMAASAMCSLRDAELPNEYWALATMYAVARLNALGRRHLAWRCPHHAFFGARPRAQWFLPFGTLCAVYDAHGVHRPHLTDKCRWALHMGSSPLHHPSSGIFYNPKEQTTTVSKSYKSFPHSEHPAMSPLETCNMLNTSGRRCATVQPSAPSMEELLPTYGPVAPPRVVTRSSGISAAASPNSCDDQPMPAPKSLAVASARADWHLWSASVKDEIEGFHRLGVYERRDQSSLPPGASILNSKIVMVNKFDGPKFVKRKSRWVVVGTGSEPAVQYDPFGCSTSPVARPSLLAMLAFSAHFGFAMRQLDVTQAFLQSYLPSPNVFVRFPKGYDAPIGADGRPQVARAIRGWYGLRDAPAAWDKLLSTFMVHAGGFTRCKSDPSVYFKRDPKVPPSKKNPGNGLTIVAFFVDDALIVSWKASVADAIVKAIGNRFPITDLGTPKYLVGARITDRLDNAGRRCISMDMQSYIAETLNELNMTDSNPTASPCSACKAHEMHAEGERDRAEMEKKPVRSAIGRLMWIANAGRPDISAAVSAVASAAHDPSPACWMAIKRILRYLKGTADLKIEWCGPKNKEAPGTCPMVVFVDASHGDADGAKSRSAVILTLAGAAFHWICRKQSCVARSSTVAEIFAVSDAFEELEYLHGFFAELGLGQGKYLVFNDNATAVTSAYKSTGKRTKTANIRYAQCRDWIEGDRAVLRRIGGAENPADALSKAVTPAVHLRHRLVYMGTTPGATQELANQWGLSTNRDSSDG